MAGDCGSCTMCCKVMGVREISKEKNQDCTHCIKGHGCTIYDTRPNNCREFKCLWLQTQELGEGRALKLSMRPDKSKVVLHVNPDYSIGAKVDPSFPTAWQKHEMATLIGALSEGVKVLVDNGKRFYLIERRGIREVLMTPPDENGIEHFKEYV